MSKIKKEGTTWTAKFSKDFEKLIIDLFTRRKQYNQELANTNYLQNDYPFSQASSSYSIIEQLENITSHFVNDQLINSELVDKIENTKLEIDNLFNEITFPFNIVDSFLNSSGLQWKNRSKREKIHSLLLSVYNEKDGLLKLIWENFLSFINSKEFVYLVKKTNLSFEEELFLKNILTKEYLFKFYQLLLPLKHVSDELLVKFNKKISNQLEENRNFFIREAVKWELLSNNFTALKSNIVNLELEILDFKSYSEDLEQKSITENKKKTCDHNLFDDDSKKFPVDAETMNYSKYFIEYNSSSNFKEAFFIGRSFLFPPSINELIEIKVIANNFSSIPQQWYSDDYKTKSLILSFAEKITDDLKLNLTILKQQISRYYFKNILIWLKKKLIQERSPIKHLSDRNHNIFFVNKKGDQEVSQEVKKVKDRHRTNNNSQENFFVFFQTENNKETILTFKERRRKEPRVALWRKISNFGDQAGLKQNNLPKKQVNKNLTMNSLQLQQEKIGTVRKKEQTLLEETLQLENRNLQIENEKLNMRINFMHLIDRKDQVELQKKSEQLQSVIRENQFMHWVIQNQNLWIKRKIFLQSLIIITGFLLFKLIWWMTKLISSKLWKNKKHNKSDLLLP